MRPFSLNKTDGNAPIGNERWRHTVQRLHFPRAGQPKSLYLRYLREGREYPSLLATNDTSQAIERGDTLSTNTYFNSFYELYWSEHTTLSDVALRVRFQGRLTLRVLRETEDATCGVIQTANLVSRNNVPEVLASSIKGIARCEGKNILAQTRRENDGRTSAPSDAISTRYVFLNSLARSESSAPRGRIFFELLGEESSNVYAVEIVTAVPPRQSVRLSIGLCTFNREDLLANTLAAISAARGIGSALSEVIIVNQGAPFTSQAILATLAGDARFRVVQQPNYGGCGGFTRTMIEAQQSAAGNTHHLVMDDDIIIESRVIETCVNILSYAHAPIVLGGHMLDALRPTTVHEAGAFLSPNNRIEPYARDVDVAGIDGLVHFSTLVRADYNGWWFCVLPLSEVSKIGYPAPIFIRGDDFEYGQRLAKAGVPTVSMPGIAVWHEPFYAKPPGWQQYYDLRNRLIFAACYPDKVRLDHPIDVLGDYFVEPLLRHNYQIAALHIKAVNDFLDGPDMLFDAPPDDTHRRVETRAATYPLQHLTSEQAKALIVGTIKPRPRGRLKIAAHCVRRIAALYALPLQGGPLPLYQQKLAHSASVGNGSYVATNVLETYHIELRPDRHHLSLGLGRALACLLRYILRRRSVAVRWRDRIATWHTIEAWEKLYHRSPDHSHAGTSTSERHL